MAEGQIPDKSVKIAAFSKSELDELVESLSAAFPQLQVGAMPLLSALIDGARRSPPETLAALLETYWDRHREQRAVAAVCDFLRAHAG